MKKKVVLLSILFVVIIWAYLSPFATGIPSEVRRELNRKFREWEIIRVHPFIEQRLQRERPKGERTNLIRGYFNDDGQTDYAVYITHRNSTRLEQSVVVLMTQKGGFRTHILYSMVIEDEALPTEQYIVLAKNGSRAFDHETHEWFRYPRDSFEWIFDSKGAVAYLYEDGEFRRIITGD